jgi:hypothetical protein
MKRGVVRDERTHVFVLNVLEEFEFSVSSFAENWGAEWLHDLLYRDRSTCKLVFRRTSRKGGC